MKNDLNKFICCVQYIWQAELPSQLIHELIKHAI